MAFTLRVPPKLQAKKDAYPYQLDAFRAIQKLPYAAIFHEQGLGKTKIAIDLMLYWLDEDAVDTVFVITKKALVENWTNEISVHSHVTPSILSSNRRENGIALNSPVIVYVMNYEVISNNYELIRLFLGTCRVGVFLDESQKIKNPDSKMAKDYHSLSSLFVRRVIMTGTPVANRPFDIWSQIKFLDGGKSLGSSFLDFRAKTDIPEQADKSGNYSAELASVMAKLKAFSVRETKTSSGLELPDKTIITHIVKLEHRQSEIYSDYRDELAHEFQDSTGLVRDDAEDLLKRLLRLVQCASNPILVDESYKNVPGKFSALTDLLESEVVNCSITTNVIVWTAFIKNAEWLRDNLKKYNPALVHGGLDIVERNGSIARFKSDDSCQLLIATPGAAKEGLTLTNANHSIFYDRSFSLDDYLQAQDRIHRISQTRDCFVHNLIAENTIDEWVDSLLNAKFKAAQLAQGDITQYEFDSTFEFDLSEALSIVLNRAGNLAN